MSEQSGPSRRNDMIVGALILLTGIIIGRVIGTDFSTLMNPGNINSQGNADSRNAASPDETSSNTDQEGQSDISSNESSFSDNRTDGGIKLIESAPMEYLQSLPAARRICFVMERGADPATAIRLNFSVTGVAASHEMYEKGIPKPTAFSMDGVRVINALENIRTTYEADEDKQRELNTFSAASFNKAYQMCPDKFMVSETQELRNFYASVGFK